MNADVDWARVKRLFAQASDLPEAERESWISSRCADDTVTLAELRSLLAARAAARTGFLDDGAQRFAPILAAHFADEASPAAGARIGAYRLLRPIGAGGMGRVFLAERADGQFAQQVALKLIRSEFSNADLRRRFARERETLARLAHANIAALHDGGVGDDDSPYFTMEFVEGESIAVWCDRHRCDVGRRIGLMLKVCDAVQYAHRNLVVHRDLKPSNVLVTAAGEPKLLDFGIAKPISENVAQADLTGAQMRPMTREYAAPEQVGGEPVTTATDVYSLGVLLYLLLSGAMPYRRAALGQAGWSRAILEEPPEPLDRAVDRAIDALETREKAAASVTTAATAAAAARSSTVRALKRTLRGDLDRIVQRALAKLPEARYATVGAMADDLRAYLDGRALSGGTRSHRARKFLRRHWLPLGAAALLVLAIVGAALLMVVDARRIEREARTTAAVKGFLIGLFTAVDPNEAKGQSITARELLDRGNKTVDAMPPQDLALKGELQSVLGRIDDQLGLYAQASDLQAHAIDALEASGADALRLAQTELDRADTLRISGDLKTALDMVSAATVHLRKVDGPAIEERERLLEIRSSIAMQKHQFDEAKPDADAAVSLARRLGNDVGQLELALQNAGNVEQGRRSLDAAEAHYREALDLALRRQGPEGLMVASLHVNIGWILADRSRYAEELAELQGALVIDTKILGAEHPTTLAIEMQSGMINYHLGHYRLARETLERVTAAQRRVLGADSAYLAGALINSGLVLTEMSELDAAEHAIAEGMAIAEKKFGPKWGGLDVARGHIGFVHLLQGKLDLAERELTGAETAARARDGKDGAVDCYRLGELARRRGDFERAKQWDERAIAAARAERAHNAETVALAHHYLGLALRDGADRAGAERELRTALAAFGGYLPNAEHPWAATTRYELGLLLIDRDDARAEGVAMLAEAARQREKFLGRDDPQTRAARAALGRFEQGKVRAQRLQGKAPARAAEPAVPRT